MGMRSMKEKVLMVILGLVVVAAIWYLMYYTPTKDEIADLQVQQQTIAEEDQTVKDQIAVFKKWQEQLGLDLDSDSDDFTKIADYNNLVQMTDELNQIFVPADSYNLNFETPARGEKYYRRNIKVNYSTATYEQARGILEQLDAMEHGCYISDVGFTVNEAKSSVSLTMSIFEYFYEEPKETPEDVPIE